MTRPTVTVETSLTTDPLDTPSWEDQTGYATSVSFRRGRDQALDGEFQPATASVVFDNPDRRFDPEHAAGDHYGDLLPGKRIRVRAGLASETVASDPATIMVLGDSIAEGWSASAFGLHWQALLRDQIRSLLGVSGGVGYIPAARTLGLGTALFPEPAHAGTVTVLNGFFGLGYRSVLIGTGGSVTYEVEGDSIDVWWVTGTDTSPIEVRVDGGLVETITTDTGAASVQDAVTEVSLGASGAHTVVLSRGAGEVNAPPLSGITVYDGDRASGVHVIDAAYAGAQMSGYAVGVTGGESFYTDLATQTSILEPDLVLIAPFVNEWISSIPVETAKANARIVVGSLLEGHPDALVAFIAWQEPSSGGGTIPWPAYVTAIHQLAVEYGAGLVDFETRPAVTLADGLHPDDDGHQTIADELFSELFSESGGDLVATTTTSYPLFAGFVDGWPQTYDFPAAASTTVPVTDGFTMLNRAELGPSPFETVLESLGPVHWWKLGETTGSSVAHDSGSAGLDGTVRGSAQDGLGADGLDPASEASALLFTSDSYVDIDGAEEWSTLVALCSSATATGGIVQSSPGRSFQWRGDGSFIAVREGLGFSDTPTGYRDGEAHLVVLVDTGTDPLIYVDGVDVTVTGGSAAFGEDRHTLGDDGSRTGSATFQYQGKLQHVSYFDYEMTGAQVTALHEAWQGYSGVTSGARIAELLDLAGWPAADRDIDTGEVTLEAVTGNQWNGNVLDTTRLIEASEAGAFYQEPDYTMRFRGRYDHLTDDRSTTSRYTFSDEDTDGVFHYAEIGFAERSTYLINRVTVVWTGGTEVVTDQASITAYGPREHQITTILPTAAQARSLAEWVIDHHSQPVLRVDSVTLDPGGDHRLWVPCLDLRVGDRVTVRKHPQEAGDPIEAEVIVEGVSGRFGQGLDGAEFTFSLSAADTRHYWMWDTDTWDETTRWA